MFIPTVWLAFVGASVASATQSADPATIVSASFGTGVSILVLFVVMHGPVATNILNLYSASLAALSLDLRVSALDRDGDRRRSSAPRRSSPSSSAITSPTSFDNWLVVGGRLDLGLWAA